MLFSFQLQKSLMIKYLEINNMPPFMLQMRTQNSIFTVFSRTTMQSKSDTVIYTLCGHFRAGDSVLFIQKPVKFCAHQVEYSMSNAVRTNT